MDKQRVVCYNRHLARKAMDDPAKKEHLQVLFLQMIQHVTASSFSFQTNRFAFGIIPHPQLNFNAII